jgi:exopolyphosphatase/guanosine-5'-triphosphate,3'-diphosphate pyrophosphatase
MRYAAIDIGSNAVKLMIGTVVDGSVSPAVIKELYARVPVRLGTDVFEMGVVGQDTLQRLLDGVKAFCLIIKVWNVDGAVVAATSAMRDSGNGTEVIEAISKESGLPTYIIKGKTEAALVTELFRNTGTPNVQKIIVDLGGGSTEITLLQRNGKMLSQSFQVGAVRSFMNKVNPCEVKKMMAWLDRHVDYSSHCIMATGGNINALRSHFGLHVPNYILMSELQDAFNTLKPLSMDERISRFLLNPDRADVIVPAAEIFLQIMKHTGDDRILVPKAGLADALILMQHSEKTPNQM